MDTFLETLNELFDYLEENDKDEFYNVVVIKISLTIFQLSAIIKNLFYFLSSPSLKLHIFYISYIP